MATTCSTNTETITAACPIVTDIGSIISQRDVKTCKDGTVTATPYTVISNSCTNNEPVPPPPEDLPPDEPLLPSETCLDTMVPVTKYCGSYRLSELVGFKIEGEATTIAKQICDSESMEYPNPWDISGCTEPQVPVYLIYSGVCDWDMIPDGYTGLSSTLPLSATISLPPSTVSPSAPYDFSFTLLPFSDPNIDPILQYQSMGQGGAFDGIYFWSTDAFPTLSGSRTDCSGS